MWPAWRVVSAGWATLQDLRSTWSLVDLLDANEALDALDEARTPKK